MSNNVVKKNAFLAVALGITMAMGTAGTYAYLTDKEQVANEFTVGDVSLEIEEDKWVRGANNVLPGEELKKNPTIKNTGTNDLIAFIEVDIPKKNIIVSQKDGNRVKRSPKDLVYLMFKDKEGAKADGTAYNESDFKKNSRGWNNNDFYIVDERINDDYHRIVFGYKKPVKPKESTTVPFDEIKVCNYVEGELNPKTQINVDVKGFAIQSDWLHDMDDKNKIKTGIDKETGKMPAQITEEQAEAIWDIYYNQNPKAVKSLETNQKTRDTTSMDAETDDAIS